MKMASRSSDCHRMPHEASGLECHPAALGLVNPSAHGINYGADLFIQRSHSPGVALASVLYRVMSVWFAPLRTKYRLLRARPVDRGAGGQARKNRTSSMSVASVRLHLSLTGSG